jgi:hypothetical protein
MRKKTCLTVVVTLCSLQSRPAPAQAPVPGFNTQVKITMMQAQLLTTEARQLADRTTRIREQLAALERDRVFDRERQLLLTSVSAAMSQ